MIIGWYKIEDEEENLIHTKCLDIFLYSAIKYTCV